MTTMSPGPTPADPSDQNVKVRPSRDAATTSDTAVMARSSPAGLGRGGAAASCLPIMADAAAGHDEGGSPVPGSMTPSRGTRSTPSPRA